MKPPPHPLIFDLFTTQKTTVCRENGRHIYFTRRYPFFPRPQYCLRDTKVFSGKNMLAFRRQASGRQLLQCRVSPSLPLRNYRTTVLASSQAEEISSKDAILSDPLIPNQNIPQGKLKINITVEKLANPFF